MPQLSFLNSLQHFSKWEFSNYFMIDVLIKEFILGMLPVLRNMEGLHAQKNRSKLGSFKIVQPAELL